MAPPVADWVASDGKGIWGQDPAPEPSLPASKQNHWGGILDTRDELFDTEHANMGEAGVGIV